MLPTKSLINNAGKLKGYTYPEIADFLEITFEDT